MSEGSEPFFLIPDEDGEARMEDLVLAMESRPAMRCSSSFALNYPNIQDSVSWLSSLVYQSIRN